MAVHRYWRLLINNSGTNWVNIAEIECRATPGGSDLTEGKAAYASHEYAGSPASAAIDNNATTQWTSSLPMPAWWACDFGTPVNVAELSIRAYDRYGDVDRNPRQFSVQCCDTAPADWTDSLQVDALPWVTATSFSVTWAVGETKTFTIPVPRSVDSVTPNTGPTIGGTAVTISGSGFTDATGATVGGVALTSFVVVDDGTITGVTGAHAAGAVDVVVTLADASTVTLAAGYTYVDSLAISPSHGPASGGTAVTLSANGWFAPGAVVTVGGGAVVATVHDANTLSFTTPQRAAGPVTVSVTAQGITKTVTFTYDLVVTPTSGPDTGGTTVRIIGVASGAPLFGGIGATAVSSFDWNSITCVTPAHSAGVVSVVVGVLTAPNAFTYVATVAPVVVAGCAPIVEIGTVTTCVGLGQLSDLGVDILCGETLELGGVRMPLAVAEGMLRGAEFLVERAYMANRDGPVIGTYHVFEGRIEADASTTALRLSIESFASALRGVLIPRTPIQERCANLLGDEACGLNRAALTLPAVAQATGARGTVATSTTAVLDAPEGRFTNGVLVVGSGACAGESRTITLDFPYGGLRGFNLSRPLSAPLQAGDNFTVFPDCAGTPAICYSFGNLDRYRGYPFLPQESSIEQPVAPTTLHFSMRFISGIPVPQTQAGAVTGSGFVENVWATIPLPVVPSAVTGATMQYGEGETGYMGAMSVQWSGGASVNVLLPVIDASIGVAVTINYEILSGGVEIDSALYGAVDLQQWGWATYTILPGLTAGEKITIGGIDFTANAPGSPPAVNRWNIGATEAESAANLALAVNSSTNATITAAMAHAQAVGASVIVTTMTTAITVTRTGGHISPPPFTDMQPMFVAGALIAVSAGPWTDGSGVSQNLDGSYTVAEVAPNRLVFISPASVSPGWDTAALPSAYLPMTVQRVS